MFFHVILTTECNLQCRYCFGEALEDVDADFLDFEVDYSLPKKISYDVGLLDTFCKRDPDCVLIFMVVNRCSVLVRLSELWTM